MFKKIILMFLILLISLIDVYGQKSRTSSMGGLSYSIIDIDEKFDPFEFGNPAWLINNETSQLLEITPSIGNSWGDYRPDLSPEGTRNYSAGFVGVKPLGSAGTFRGSAVYDYEMRRNNAWTLKKDTYSGEAFYFCDSTIGDFRYNGPTFEFMHSLELIDNLFIGASASYKISDGLKKVYTYAQTLYRNVGGNIGLAYAVTNDLSIGANFRIKDEQEKIEASDVNLLTVQTYHYRGENNYIELRGSSQDYKIKKRGKTIGSQLYWTPGNFEFGASAKFSSSHTKSLFPVSSIIDVEDGYAEFEHAKINLKGRYKFNERLTIGVSGGFNKDESWSKNSPRNLLLWEWENKSFFAGIGSSYQIIQNKLLIGVEYEMHNVDSDSVKHVDHLESSLSSTDHIVRTGVEYHLNNQLSVRGGYNYASLEHDFVIGGDDIKSHLYSLGCSLNIIEDLEIDARIEYADTKVENNNNIKNARWSGIITLRIFSF